MTEAPLEQRFAHNLRRLIGKDHDHLLVAFSGGMDSTVLLHLLRMYDHSAVRITAAHFDHRMRPESGSDAEWARQLCQSWGIEIEMGVAEADLKGEAAARDARYTFLRERALHVGAGLIVTAHHADDQAETVLFRIIRGTGLQGLSGIPARTRSGIIRPLLPFWRAELADYAVRRGLSWRADPSNETLAPARNRIRLSILPEIEREISSAARRNLVALAELAREAEVGWRSLLAAARKDVIRREGEALVLARDRLRGYDRPVQTRLVRHALRSFGIVPSRAGTRIALAFITDAPSGREHRLSDGVTIRTEFEGARIGCDDPAPGPDVPLSIESMAAGPDASEVRVGGRRFRVEIREATLSDEPVDRGAVWAVRLPAPLDFPLTIRSRRPGDTVHTTGGSKSLKKLMIERRVPLRDRAQRPVLLDASGRVLWVAGLGTFGGPHGSERSLDLTFHEV